MSRDSGPELTDKGRLLFGSGFVFGVMFALVILGVVTATVVGDGVLASEVAATIAAGVVFTAIVAIAMYFLAFRDNRISVPVARLFDRDE